MVENTCCMQASFHPPSAVHLLSWATAISYPTASIRPICCPTASPPNLLSSWLHLPNTIHPPYMIPNHSTAQPPLLRSACNVGQVVLGAVRPRDGVALLDGPAQHGPMIRRASELCSCALCEPAQSLTCMLINDGMGDPVTRCSGTMRVHWCEWVT